MRGDLLGTARKRVLIPKESVYKIPKKVYENESYSEETQYLKRFIKLTASIMLKLS